MLTPAAIAGPLAGVRVAPAGDGPGSGYANWLLSMLGADRGSSPAPAAGIATGAAGAALAFGALTRIRGCEVMVDASRLLAQRAALLDQELPRRSCRLLRTCDGWLAVNAPRPCDFDLFPAWAGNAAVDGWDALAQWLERQPTGEALRRGRALGLAISTPGEARTGSPWEVTLNPPARVDRRPPLVVDLSALWAGPLAGSLLRLAGARVVKVESSTRPDALRGAHPTFFEALNAGKEHVVLDFAERAPLHELIASAGLVLTSCRPRALDQLGLVPRAGQSWVRIRAHHDPNQIGFGDDVAVAGGLMAWEDGPEGPLPAFCGDAIADPLTGLHAAVAGLACLVGAPAVVDVVMAGVVACVATQAVSCR